MADDRWSENEMFKRRRRLYNEARNKGAEAGRKLLSTTLEALAKAIDEKPLNNADLETLDFLRTGLYVHLTKGKPLDEALDIYLQRGGRPARAMYDVQQMYAQACELAKRFKSEGRASPVGAAKQELAKSYGLSQSQVHRICGRLVLTKSVES